MVFRVDLSAIVERMEKAQLPLDSWAFYLLPVMGNEILKDVIGERLVWRATYNAKDMPDGQWREVLRVANNTHQGLDNMFLATDIIDRLEAIESAMSGLNSDDFEQILQLLQEVDDMNVTINNNVGGCGCGCGSSTSSNSTQAAPDYDPTDDSGGTSLPVFTDVPEPEDSAFSTYKCNAVQHQLALIRMVVIQWQSLLSVADGQVNYEQVKQVLQDVFGTVAEAYEVSAIVWFWFVEYAINYLTESTVVSIVNWIDDNHNEIADAMYCTDGSEAMLSAFKAMFDNSNLSSYVKLVLFWGIYKMADFSWIYNDVEDRVEVPSYAHECSCSSIYACGLFDLPEGWECQEIELDYNVGTSTVDSIARDSGGGYDIVASGGSAKSVELNGDLTEYYDGVDYGYRALIYVINRNGTAFGEYDHTGEINNGNITGDDIHYLATAGTSDIIQIPVELAFPDHDVIVEPHVSTVTTFSLTVGNRYGNTDAWSANIKAYIIRQAI